jgi:hypothetical protein
MALEKNLKRFTNIKIPTVARRPSWPALMPCAIRCDARVEAACPLTNANNRQQHISFIGAPLWQASGHPHFSPSLSHRYD